MIVPVDLRCVTPTERMVGEDEDETLELRQMLDRAESYLSAFHWCPPVTERYLGIGIGGIIALFLFRLARPINRTDDWLWVVEGDLPSAYLVVDEASEPAHALIAYCTLMEEWSNAVLQHLSLDGVFPVKAQATEQNATTLLRRIGFIREHVVHRCHRAGGGR
jgi:hypothetical protein